MVRFGDVNQRVSLFSLANLNFLFILSQWAKDGVAQAYRRPRAGLKVSIACPWQSARGGQAHKW
jgi:hypothetical protein